MASTAMALALTCLSLAHAYGPPYIYTYDLPKEFTEDIASMPLNRTKDPWIIWYDMDQVSLAVVKH